MKTATIIEGLVLREVPIQDGQKDFTYSKFKERGIVDPADFGGVLEEGNDIVQAKIVPIYEFNRFYEEKRKREPMGYYPPEAERRHKAHDYTNKSHNVFEEIYIALTEEVQQYLRLPLDTLKAQVDVQGLDIERKKAALKVSQEVRIELSEELEKAREWKHKARLGFVFCAVVIGILIINL